MPNFSSINNLIETKDIAWGALADEIESRGVYEFRSNGPHVFHGPDSHHAEMALVGVAVNLLHDRHPPSHEFETWFSESDPANQYGWPTAKLPSFRSFDDYSWIESYGRLEVRAALFNAEIYTVGRLLLTNKANPGAIAAVFEQEGIFGFDEYGSLNHFDKNSNIAKSLLEALSNYASNSRPGSVLDINLLNNPTYATYGWPRDMLPDFAAVEAAKKAQVLMKSQTLKTKISEVTPPQLTSAQVQPQPQPERDMQTKERNAYNSVIAGLLWYISGDLGCEKHPDFARSNSQNALIDHLVKELKDVLPGVSTSNLKNKFKEANKLRSNIGLPPLKPERDGVVGKKIDDSNNEDA